MRSFNSLLEFQSAVQDGDDYYYDVWCEDDQEWCVESIGNPYSVKIKEIDVIEVLDDLEVLRNDS